MGFLKSLFGSTEESPEEKEKEEQARKFDLFKYDGVKAARIGKYQYAVQCYRAALDIKDEPELHELLATALINCGEGDAAIAEMRGLTEIEPDNVKLWLRLAHYCYLEDKYDDMNVAAKKAMELEPDNTDVLFASAQSAIGLGNQEEAIDLLSKAISLRDDFGDAFLLRGRTYLKMNLLPEANADADSLLQRAPEHEEVLLLKANILTAEGKTDEALNIYNKVLDVNPFNVEALRVVNPDGLTDVNTGETEEDIEQKTKDAYKNTLNPFGF